MTRIDPALGRLHYPHDLSVHRCGSGLGLSHRLFRLQRQRLTLCRTRLPDDELTELAARSALSDPAVVSKQVDRMLADPRAEGFVQGFARQWIRIDEFDRFPPDEQIFPDYYATDMVGLGADMEEQPLAFFREVLHRDLPVSSFLNSDWTMLNERLAQFYGIEGVNGEELSLAALETRLVEAKQNYADQAVVIRGEGTGLYQHVMDVLAVCHQAKIKTVALANRLQAGNQE